MGGESVPNCNYLHFCKNLSISYLELCKQFPPPFIIWLKKTQRVAHFGFDHHISSLEDQRCESDHYMNLMILGPVFLPIVPFISLEKKIPTFGIILLIVRQESKHWVLYNLLGLAQMLTKT